MEFSPAVRTSNIEAMKSSLLDVVVIGGGITGAGIARDTAMRGLSVGLLEKEDFASGTSSKSARLVHGGVRYLENRQFGLVLSACTERHALHRLAPRLVRPLAFTFPVYRTSKNSLLTIRVGMWLYDLMALFRTIQRHKMMGAEQASVQEPGLSRQGLVGAASYYDCLTDDARLTLTTIQSAHRCGALAANHVEAVGLVKDEGRVAGVQVVDQIDGERFAVRARVTVNAAGVWVDRIRLMDDPSTDRMIRVNRGSHLVLPRHKLQIHNAVAFGSADGQRAMYAVPWGETCIVGTTDVDHGWELDQVYATAEEVESMLASVNAAFPDARLTPGDIISTYAGLRPLIAGKEEAAYQASRDHHIVESEAGLVSIAGGKLTTYRRMAEDLVDVVSKKLEKVFNVKTEGCETRDCPLAETTFDLDREVTRLVGEYPYLDHDVVTHLALAYGPASPQVLAFAQDDAGMRSRLVPNLPYILAEVPYVIKHEMALTLNDVLIRRMHVIHEASDQGVDCAPLVAATMAPHLGWDAAEIGQQVDDYFQQVALSRAFEARRD
ncbi:MAG: glycerol-3-phosphate dehydrogenase/oxidase [Anaerolineae bacterium]|nr:glycerol-3-phosphate dehydrogenase/oxidase [Anaerolineae bacterium]